MDKQETAGSMEFPPLKAAAQLTTAWINNDLYDAFHAFTRKIFEIWKKITIGMDSTVTSVSGNQSGAKKGRNSPQGSLIRTKGIEILPSAIGILL